MSRDDLQDRSVGGGAGAATTTAQLREFTTDALRYWELRRVVYNLILAVIVMGHFLAAWPESRSVITFDGILALFLLAVLANVAFCAVYVGDVFIQFSGFRDSRRNWRWLMLLVGFSFAAALTHFFSDAIFSVRQID